MAPLAKPTYAVCLSRSWCHAYTVSYWNAICTVQYSHIMCALSLQIAELLVTKLGTNSYHVNGHCWKGFQGRGMKINVTQQWPWKSCELELLNVSEPKRKYLLCSGDEPIRGCGVKNKIIDVQMCECYNDGEGAHFDRVVSKLTCCKMSGSVYVKVAQLQHVVSVKDALLQVYTRTSDEMESTSTYVISS